MLELTIHIEHFISFKLKGEDHNKQANRSHEIVHPDIMNAEEKHKAMEINITSC